MEDDLFLDTCHITVEKRADGESELLFIKDGKRTRITPKRLFPISRPSSYITCLDEINSDVAIIRHLRDLRKDLREAVSERLQRYYFIPRITEIHEIEDRHGISRWKVMTDKGRREFEIRSRNTDITIMDKRILIRDTEDNTYEIPDYTKLPVKSRAFIDGEI